MIYANPIKECKSDKGEPISTFVVDTQGLYASEDQSEMDIRIMSLCVLLSS